MLKINKAPVAVKSSEFDTHLATPVVATTTKEKVVAKTVVEEKTEEEVLHPGLMIKPSELHHIEVGGSITKNLGHFESARFHVTVRAPTTKEDLEATYKWATEWVSEKIAKAQE